MRGGMIDLLPNPKYVEYLQVPDLDKLLKEKGFKTTDPEYIEAFHKGRDGLIKLYKDYTTPTQSRSGSDIGDTGRDDLAGTKVMVVTELKEKDGQVKYEVEETYADDEKSRKAAV